MKSERYHLQALNTMKVSGTDEEHVLAMQLIREAIKEHTGVEPPRPPLPPKLEAYGEVGLYENATLRSQLKHLYPGDGITSRHPLIMEEYGQSCAPSLSTFSDAAALPACLVAIFRDANQ